MEPIRINPDEFKLENFINYYNDNVEELLSEYPNYVSRICLIDRDYMDVVIFDEDYEELEDASDYKKLLLNGEYALHFAIGKTYEGAEKVEFIDGKKYIRELKDSFPFSVVTREFYKGKNVLVKATLVENKTNSIKIANEKSKEREDDWYIRQRGER